MPILDFCGVDTLDSLFPPNILEAEEFISYLSFYSGECVHNVNLHYYVKIRGLLALFKTFRFTITFFLFFLINRPFRSVDNYPVTATGVIGIPFKEGYSFVYINK